MKRKHLLIALLLCLALLLSACANGALSMDAKPAAALSGGDAKENAAEKPLTGTPEIAGDLGGAVGEFYYSGKSSADGRAAVDKPGGTAPGTAPGEGEPGEAAPDSIDGDDGDPPVEPAAPDGDEPVSPPPSEPASGLVLTAAEWNDNRNWPFFTNLVNEGHISFPSFGVDPRQRIEVVVTDAAEAPLVNETVVLLDAEGAVLWTARTDKEGRAYVFYAEEQTPEKVVCGEAEAEVVEKETGGDPQGQTVMRPIDSIALIAAPAAPAQTGLQVMFIVDTTGSMGDELAYLQKDFSAIAERVGSEGVRWAVSFYRDEGDEYVTRHNPFSSDVALLQEKISAEYADGGGDEPEAVAEVLTECLTEREDWDENASKLAFLIFDAPPHEGREAALQAAVKAAAEKGIRLIPVVASNAARETELFGRAIAICTNGTYVFLTDDSGVGESHLEPIVGKYDVKLLQDLIVEIIERWR